MASTEPSILETRPKYDLPLILCLDVPDVAKALIDAGFNVEQGSLGRPYSVERSATPYPLDFSDAAAPRIGETDIVILNNKPLAPKDQANGKPPGQGVRGLWMTAESGQIDPRPSVLRQLAPGLEKLIAQGGSIILFADDLAQEEVISGRLDGRHVSTEGTTSVDNWGSIPSAKARWVKNMHGSVINVVSGLVTTGLLKTGFENATYEAILDAESDGIPRWKALATNKHGEVVAGLMLPAGDAQGPVFLLPQCPRFSKVVVDFLTSVVAALSPKLFPLHEGGKWIHRDDYEAPDVIEKKQKLAILEKDYEDAKAAIEASILETRRDSQHLYDLLTETGSALVNAVKHVFEQFGFSGVIDVDREMLKKSVPGELREDLRIEGSSPKLIINVKGITGKPEDNAVGQAEKHALMRAREFQGDVKPITIINHQRNLPPAERDYPAYRPAIVETATQAGNLLITTWDLFRLQRDAKKLGWPSDAVRGTFLRSGLFSRVPTHYEMIGTVVKVWEGRIGVVLERKLTAGDRIAVMINDAFVEDAVISLAVDDVDRREAAANDRCGIAHTEALVGCKPGMSVYRVAR